MARSQFITSPAYAPPSSNRKTLYLRIAGVSAGVILFALLLILIIWLVLRPTKPTFILSQLTVLQFQLIDPTAAAIPLTGPSLFHASLQPTITSLNPNKRIDIVYNKVDVYASYQAQMITVATALPSDYIQRHRQVAVWSPLLYGTAIPVSSALLVPFAEDTKAGVMLVEIELQARIRWMVGSWVSGRYLLTGRCPAILTSVGNGTGGFKMVKTSTCEVDV